MTELMKRYEKDFEKGLTHECYQSWLETEISDNERYIATLKSKIVMYEYEIKQLEAQLTWRPVSEKPKENDEDYFTMSANGDVVKMRYHDGAFFVWDDEVSAFFLPTQHPLEKPKYWLPIPPAPKGEVK